MGKTIRLTQRVTLAQQAVQMAVNELAKQNPEVRPDFWLSWDFKLVGTNDDERTILCRAILKKQFAIVNESDDCCVHASIPVRAICKIILYDLDPREYNVKVDIWIGFDKGNQSLVNNEYKQFIENNIVRVIRGRFQWFPLLYSMHQLDESDLPLLPPENFLSFNEPFEPSV